MDHDTAPSIYHLDGQLPNLTYPSTLMVPVIITCLFVFAVPTLFVIVRIFAKVYLSQGHYIEDWLSYLAWVGLVPYTGILFHTEEYVFVRHQWELSVTQFINVLDRIYALTTPAAKLSILFQIKRIFATGIKEAVYWATVVSIVANALFYILLFLVSFFRCWPRDPIGNVNIPGLCVSAIKTNTVAAILNLISDLEALFLPAWIIWYLRMPVKRRLAAFLLLSIGSLFVLISSTMEFNRGSSTNRTY
ncbi:hypothetical protein F5X98DRAFT_389965 [Xylaria grammica]|nr:hypothetical protein F5X98DRAFT_389965 [Xylaria grammica]